MFQTIVELKFIAIVLFVTIEISLSESENALD